METTYRVLISGTLTSRLPLVGADGATAPQEFSGYGYEGDFTGAEDNGRYGEVWEFTTFSETAMEQALNSDPAVIAYKRIA